jgi:flap endonuclease-1
MENGIRPCWVFDGKSPEAKKKILEKRKQKKELADKNKVQAIEENDMEQVLKYAGQSVRVTEKMTEDAKTLIKLLGLPLIEVNK